MRDVFDVYSISCSQYWAQHHHLVLFSRDWIYPEINWELGFQKCFLLAVDLLSLSGGIWLVCRSPSPSTQPSSRALGGDLHMSTPPYTSSDHVIYHNKGALLPVRMLSSEVAYGELRVLQKQAGVRPLAPGQWTPGSGGWTVDPRVWRVDSGPLGLEGGQRTPGSGGWTSPWHWALYSNRPTLMSSSILN